MSSTETTAQAALAKSKEQTDAILAAQIEREKWMPTPTQEENDQAAMGIAVEKKPDGSPVELTAEQHAEANKKKQAEAKHLEARKPESGAGYTTRMAEPHSGKHPEPHKT